jgi:hypothetical protein
MRSSLTIVVSEIGLGFSPGTPGGHEIGLRPPGYGLLQTETSVKANLANLGQGHADTGQSKMQLPAPMIFSYLNPNRLRLP